MAARPEPGHARAGTADDRVYRTIAVRLVPLLFVCYTVAYLDRVNVGFARLQASSRGSCST